MKIIFWLFQFVVLFCFVKSQWTLKSLHTVGYGKDCNLIVLETLVIQSHGNFSGFQRYIPLTNDQITGNVVQYVSVSVFPQHYSLGNSESSLSSDQSSLIVDISIYPIAPPSANITFILGYTAFDGIREVGSTTLPDKTTPINEQNNVVVHWDIFGANWPSFTSSAIVDASITIVFQSAESGFSSIQVYPSSGSTVNSTQATLAIFEKPMSSVGVINEFYFPGPSICTVEDGYSSPSHLNPVTTLALWAILVIALGGFFGLLFGGFFIWCCCCRHSVRYNVD